MIADIPPLNERHKFIRDMKPSFQHFDLNKLSICQIILDRQLFDFNLLVENAISPGIIYSFCGGNISVVLKSVENNNVTWDLELNKNIINHDIKIYNFDNRIFSEYRLKVEQNLKKEQIYIINKYAPCLPEIPDLLDNLNLILVKDIINTIPNYCGVRSDVIEELVLFALEKNKQKYFDALHNVDKYITIPHTELNIEEFVFNSLDTAGISIKEQENMQLIGIIPYNKEEIIRINSLIDCFYILHCKNEAGSAIKNEYQNELDIEIKINNENKYINDIEAIITNDNLCTHVYSNIKLKSEEIFEGNLFNYSNINIILDKMQNFKLFIEMPVVSILEKIQIINDKIRTPNLETESFADYNEIEIEIEPIDFDNFYDLYCLKSEINCLRNREIAKTLFDSRKNNYIFDAKCINKMFSYKIYKEQFTSNFLPSADKFLDKKNTDLNKLENLNVLIDCCIDLKTRYDYNKIKIYLYHELKLKGCGKLLAAQIIDHVEKNSRDNNQELKKSTLKSNYDKWEESKLYKYLNEQNINLNLIACLK